MAEANQDARERITVEDGVTTGTGPGRAGESIALPPVIITDAGTIQNIPLKYQRWVGVSVIHCKAGSKRSNHWHRSDWHQLYVVSGEMLYVECDVLDSGGLGPRAESVYRAGECVFTGPHKAHATFFPVDTVLVSIAARPQDADSRGADCVRLKEPLL